MKKAFTKEVLMEQITKEKALARKQGKIEEQEDKGFAPKVKEIVSGRVSVINSFPPTEVSVEESQQEEEKKKESLELQSEENKEQEISTVSLDVVKNLINGALQTQREENSQLNQQIEELKRANDSLKEENQGVKEERDRFKKDASVLKEIGKLSGVSEFPNVNTLTSVSNSPKGLCDELLNILNDRDLSKINTNVAGHSPTTGLIHATQRNPKSSGAFIQRSFKEARAKGLGWQDSQIIKDVEDWAKSNGFLKGRPFIQAAGATTGDSGSVPDAFLDVLSSIMRETHSQSNIFWQFVRTMFDSTSAPGKNILVPRFNALPQPTSLADFILADTTTYNPIDLTIGSSTDSQNLEMGTVPIDCKQWGIGRGTSVGTRPVYISAFHEETSLVNLMDAVNSQLMRNYYQFEELLVRTEYEKATTVVYNDNGSVTSTAGDIAVGDKGDMSREFLTSVYSEMYAAQIPTFPDGSYCLALNPTASGQLKLSYDKILALPNMEQIENVSNMLRQVSGFDFGRVSNYLGFAPDGFHLFLGNSFGVGAAGSSPTVNNENFASGVDTQVTNDSFAFGPGCVGRGIALPAEIRSQDAPFQLGSGYIWVERGGVGPMDLDSSLPGNGQTRCWKLRTLRKAV